MANNKTTISGSIMRSGQRSNAPGVEKIVSEIKTLDDAITSLFTDDSGLGGVYGTLNKVMDLVNDTNADLSKEDKRIADIVKQKGDEIFQQGNVADLVSSDDILDQNCIVYPCQIIVHLFRLPAKLQYSIGKGTGR